MRKSVQESEANRRRILLAAVVVAVLGEASLGELKLDERDAGAEEWGYRPAAGSVSNVNPPSFSPDFSKPQRVQRTQRVKYLLLKEL
jgi:hypothetical protein